MKENLFRKTSLEKLSSPDELDQLITITNPRGWIALAGFIVILTTGILWSIVGEIPLTVSGEGMIIASNGVASVVHSAEGTITDVTVRPGDYVKKGDVLARVDQTELVNRINQLKSDIETANAFDVKAFDPASAQMSPALSDLYTLGIESKKADAYVRIQQSLSEYKQSELALRQAEITAADAKRNFDKKRILYDQGAIAQSEFDSASLQLETADMQAATAKEALRTAQLNAQTLVEKSDAGSLKEQVDVKKTVIIRELELALNTAQDQLQANSEIVAQADGRIIEVIIKKGDVIESGAPIATVIGENQTLNSREVVLYVSPEEGKKIHEGMSAHISPTIVKKEEYGYILGTVTAVSKYPVSQQSILQTVGNSALAEKFSAGSSPVEVRVNLISDTSTVSGFKWSTSKGPAIQIDSGNICNGSVVTTNVKPIALVIPYLKKKLNMY